MNIQEGTQNGSVRLMTDYSVASLHPSNDGEEYHANEETGFPGFNHSDNEFSGLCSFSECNVIRGIAFLICSLGLVGNGMVIWLLGFRMKRNPFTVFILNLAVADFGILACRVMDTIVYTTIYFSKGDLASDLHSLWAWLFFLSIVMHLAGQFLLTAISIDRCTSVLFPIWHRCHRPACLSAAVCASLWVISSLLCLIACTELHPSILGTSLTILTVTPLLCLPLMTISSVILFIKICLKSPKHKRGKAAIAIFLTLLFFLLFAFPLTACLLVYMYILPELEHHRVIQYTLLGASLNSSLNPFIYFLVGRKTRGQRKEKMKNILQRLFKEE